MKPAAPVTSTLDSMSSPNGDQTLHYWRDFVKVGASETQTRGQAAFSELYLCAKKKGEAMKLCILTVVLGLLLTLVGTASAELYIAGDLGGTIQNHINHVTATG